VRRSIRKAVEDALADTPDDWQTTLARKLGRALDEEPNASMARELRALMRDITESTPAKEATVADELRAKRAARQARTAAE
jgi:hypothetical protein